ncbi:tropomyosin-like [Pituophis catenifer annectens]|uniref:tropomyosin-like n=1 Tax=Pituophis catenifer annectens TaxID=94852 RepID=UPI003995B4D5
MTKPGKKAIANQAMSITSSAQQKTIDTMLLSEKEKSPQSINIKNIHSVLSMIQESMNKTQESIADNHQESRKNHEDLKMDIGEIKDNLKKMDNKIEKIQQNIAKNEQRIQNTEDKMGKVEKKIEESECAQTIVNKELEDSISFLEMEKALFYLRFQNIVENREEDLRDVMVGILAEATLKNKEEINKEIDEIYRVFTNYAQRNRLPKEVHIRFVRKLVKEEIYKKMREKPIIYKGKEIITLKQIPRRIRETRKNYNFLTTELHKHKIMFRWLTPEGLLVSWQDKKYKLDTLEKA